MQRLRAEYGTRVRFVVKLYPYRYRDFAHIAAEAALAAGDQGRYWEMHELLLKRSPQLDRASLIKYAGELGLDVGKFSASLEGKKHAALIERDVKLAISMDLYSTPTFFINGRKVVGNVPYSYLKKVLDEELKGAVK